MPLEFFRNAEDTLLFDTVSAAFAADRIAFEPGTDAARRAAQATVASLELIQPVVPRGGSEAGIGLQEASTILEAAGRSQLTFPLAESLVLVSTLVACHQTLESALLDGSVTAHLSGTAMPRHGGEWEIALGAPCDKICRTVVVPSHSGRALTSDNDMRPLFWVLAAADILGAAQWLFERSVGYLGERHQFGNPLHSYQALRHRAADDWVRIEDMRASIDYAAVMFDSGADASEVLEAARVAKATASEAGTIVAENAIQYHGAIGFTWDLGLHFALGRIKQLSLIQGTASDHYRLIGARYLENFSDIPLNPGT